MAYNLNFGHRQKQWQKIAHFKSSLKCITKLSVEISVYHGIQCRVEISNPEDSLHDIAWCITCISAHWWNGVPEYGKISTKKQQC